MGGKDLHAESHRLGPHGVGQRRAAYPIDEPRVVFDHLGGSRLTAQTAALDNQGLYTLAGSVQGRGQSGGAAPHHDQVIILPFGLGADAQLGGQIGVGRLHQDGPILKDYGWDYLAAFVGPLHVLPAFLVLVDVHPIERDTLLT